MGHPVAEYRQEVAALQAELAELKARLGIKPAEAEPPIDPRLIGAPAGAFLDTSGILRTGRGDVIVPEGVPSYETRQAVAKAQREAKEKAEWAAMTAALPAGLYRDFGGVIRRIEDGKVVSAVDLEDAQISAVERQRATEHRFWKAEQNLPVHPLDEEGEC